MIKKETTVTSLKWSVLGQIIPQLLSPLLTIYIARILSPEAYGIIAIATISISFVTIFIANGLNEGLIQKQGNQAGIYKAADFVFSFNLILSAILFIVIVLSSSAIANFFHNTEAKLVISVLSFGIVLNSLGGVQLAMLQKKMDFKSIFFRQIIPVLSQLIIVLPMVWLGFEVWALVAGALTSNLLATVILWIKSDWKPKINLNFKENKVLLNFGLFLIAEAVLGWVMIQGDNIIVGKYLSVHELGLYKTGYDLDSKLFLTFLGPAAPVLYAKLCSLGTAEEKNRLYTKIKTYLAIIVFPIMFGIILIHGYFDNLILNSKWQGIGFVMAMLAINPGISNLWLIFPQYMRSLGKPQISTLITLIGAAIFFPVYFIAVGYGFNVFIISRVSLGIVGVILFTYFESKELKITILASIESLFKPLLASVIMLIVGFVFQEFVFQDYTVLSLFSLISIGIFTYGILSYIFLKTELTALRAVFLKKKL